MWKEDYEIVARDPKGGKVIIDVWAPIGFRGYAELTLTGSHKLSIPKRVDLGPEAEIESNSLVKSFTVNAVVGQQRGRYTVEAKFFAPDGSLITTDETRFIIK